MIFTSWEMEKSDEEWLDQWGDYVNGIMAAFKWEGFWGADDEEQEEEEEAAAAAAAAASNNEKIEKLQVDLDDAVDGFCFCDDRKLEMQFRAASNARSAMAFMDIDQDSFVAGPSLAAARELYPTVESIDQTMERVKAHLDSEKGEGDWTKERYLLVAKTARMARHRVWREAVANGHGRPPPSNGP